VRHDVDRAHPANNVNNVNGAHDPDDADKVAGLRAGTEVGDVTDAALAAWPLPQHSVLDDKEQRGRVLVIAGSIDVPGAAILAGIAALHAGAGKLVVATPQAVAVPIATQLLEARVLGLDFTADAGLAGASRDALQEAVEQATVVVIGPGMHGDQARACMDVALRGPASTRMVVDAAALDTLRPALQAQRADGHADPPPRLLTPHAGEAAALLGMPRDEVVADPLRAARQLSARHGAWVALKGPTTVIVAPDGATAWRHVAECAGLGTSGSGDVLAGLIGGLAARGAGLDQAAVWGVALHARAGHRLTAGGAALGFLARELSAEVPFLMTEMGSPTDHHAD